MKLLKFAGTNINAVEPVRLRKRIERKKNIFCVKASLGVGMVLYDWILYCADIMRTEYWKFGAIG